MKFVLSLVAILSLQCLVFADDSDSLTRPSHYLIGFFGQSATILGSEDGRYGGGIGYAYGQPEKRFKMGGALAQLVYEGYVDHTESDGSNTYPANATVALGGLAYARWRWPLDREGNGFYTDLGWGLQFANQPTLDLDTRLNSTPVLDFGGTIKDGHTEYMVGIRYLHISNAGTDRPNYGQNEFFFTVGIRY